MTSTPTRPTVALLASGGLDSSILLAHLLDLGQRVRPFYIRFGLAWQDAELAALGRFMIALDRPRLERLTVLDMPVADLYGDHWSLTGRNVPGAETTDDAVYLPGRNALLILKAAIWCALNGIEELALAPLRSNPFSDATPAFFGHLESVLNCGPGGRVRLARPFAAFTKQQVMQLGRDYPLELTYSCIDPRGELHCGECNKCGERREAFRLAGLADPTRYHAVGNSARCDGSGARGEPRTVGEKP